MKCFSIGFILFVFSLVTSLNSLQAEAGPHNTGLVSSVNLGIRYSSLLRNRGLVYYRDFQIDPAISVFFLDDRVEFVGESIGYRDFVYSDVLRLRTQLVSISDQPLFPKYASIRDGIVRRPKTYEWANRVELFLPGYNDQYQAELDFGVAKDISIHHGHYLDVLGKVKLFDFKAPLINYRIEPNVFVNIGWGDAAHNQYYYGPSMYKSGLNNISYGLWFAFPEDSDRFYPIIQITRFDTIGDFKAGEYAVGRNQGWLFSVIATHRFIK